MSQIYIFRNSYIKGPVHRLKIGVPRTHLKLRNPVYFKSFYFHLSLWMLWPNLWCNSAVPPQSHRNVLIILDDDVTP